MTEKGPRMTEKMGHNDRERDSQEDREMDYNDRERAE